MEWTIEGHLEKSGSMRVTLSKLGTLVSSVASAFLEVETEAAINSLTDKEKWSV